MRKKFLILLLCANFLLILAACSKRTDNVVENTSEETNIEEVYTLSEDDMRDELDRSIRRMDFSELTINNANSKWGGYGNWKGGLESDNVDFIIRLLDGLNIDQYSCNGVTINKYKEGIIVVNDTEENDEIHEVVIYSTRREVYRCEGNIDKTTKKPIGIWDSVYYTRESKNGRSDSEGFVEITGNVVDGIYDGTVSIYIRGYEFRPELKCLQTSYEEIITNGSMPREKIDAANGIRPPVAAGSVVHFESLHTIQKPLYLHDVSYAIPGYEESKELWAYQW